MRVCIDPGHGNGNRKAGVYDPGAVSGTHTEADIVLQWGVSGRWILTQHGIAVYMTRDDDSDPDPVSTRDDRAEAAGCTHFLSLHCNAAASAQATGTETFYRDARDKVFAASVQKAAVQTLGRRDRGLKAEGESQHNRLAVFDFDGPAALLEIGFIGNPTDRGKMLLRASRVAFWEALAVELKAL